MILLGILGGLETFGLIGLFLGPAIMAAVFALWREAAKLISACELKLFCAAFADLALVYELENVNHVHRPFFQAALYQSAP